MQLISDISSLNGLPVLNMLIKSAESLSLLNQTLQTLLRFIYLCLKYTHFSPLEQFDIQTILQIYSKQSYVQLANKDADPTQMLVMGLKALDSIESPLDKLSTPETEICQNHLLKCIYLLGKLNKKNFVDQIDVIVGFVVALKRDMKNKNDEIRNIALCILNLIIKNVIVLVLVLEF